MKYKKSLCAALCIAGVAVYMLCIQQLIGRSLPQRFYKLDTDLNSLEKNKVYCDIYNTNSVTDNLFEEVFINFWASLEPDDTSGGNAEDRKIGIILNNSNGSYIYAAVPTGDKLDALEVTGHKPRWKSVQVEITPSTLLVPNGTYDVYIYCYDGESDYGIKKTGYTLKKNGVNTRIGCWAEPVELNLPEKAIADAETMVISTVVDNVGTLVVDGWAFVPETDSSKQRAYVRLTYGDGSSDVFTARKYERDDVPEVYGSELYSMCGVRSEILAEQLHSPDFIAAIVVEDAQGILHIRQNTVSVDLSEYGEPQADATTLVISSNMSDKGELVVDGWGFVPEMDCAEQRAYVRLTYEDGSSDVFTARKYERDDVPEVYGSELYRKCGVRSKISTDLLRSENFAVSIIIEDATGVLHAAEER